MLIFKFECLDLKVLHDIPLARAVSWGKALLFLAPQLFKPISSGAIETCPSKTFKGYFASEASPLEMQLASYIALTYLEDFLLFSGHVIVHCCRA